MATNTLQNETAAATPALSTSTQAFLTAFRDSQRFDNEPIDSAQAAYAGYAHCGALHMRRHAYVEDPNEAAISALIGICDLNLIIADFFTAATKRDDDELEALRGVRDVLVNQWRYHDMNGGTACRDFALYVDAPRWADFRRWESEGLQVIDGQLMRFHPEAL